MPLAAPPLVFNGSKIRAHKLHNASKSCSRQNTPTKITLSRDLSLRRWERKLTKMNWMDGSTMDGWALASGQRFIIPDIFHGAKNKHFFWLENVPRKKLQAAMATARSARSCSWTLLHWAPAWLLWWFVLLIQRLFVMESLCTHVWPGMAVTYNRICGESWTPGMNISCWRGRKSRKLWLLWESELCFSSRLVRTACSVLIVCSTGFSVCFSWTVEPLVTSSQSGGCHTTRLFTSVKLAFLSWRERATMFFPTRHGDLECKIGRLKVIEESRHLCSWSECLKVSGLYHKKGQILWRFEIVLGGWKYLFWKIQRKSSRRKGNGPQDMEIDHVGTVQSSLSSNACQTRLWLRLTLRTRSPWRPWKEKERFRCIPHVSAAENVGHFKNMWRECQVKSFDGLGPFSYVCRMMRFSKPNTNEFEPEGGSVYSERCVGDQHYVCVVNPDQQNPERVRGFPVGWLVDYKVYQLAPPARGVTALCLTVPAWNLLSHTICGTCQVGIATSWCMPYVVILVCLCCSACFSCCLFVVAFTLLLLSQLFRAGSPRFRESWVQGRKESNSSIPDFVEIFVTHVVSSFPLNWDTALTQSRVLLIDLDALAFTCVAGDPSFSIGAEHVLRLFEVRAGKTSPEVRSAIQVLEVWSWEI